MLPVGGAGALRLGGAKLPPPALDLTGTPRPDNERLAGRTLSYTCGLLGGGGGGGSEDAGMFAKCPLPNRPFWFLLVSMFSWFGCCLFCAAAMFEWEWSPVAAWANGWMTLGKNLASCEKGDWFCCCADVWGWLLCWFWDVCCLFKVGLDSWLLVGNDCENVWPIPASIFPFAWFACGDFWLGVWFGLTCWFWKFTCPGGKLFVLVGVDWWFWDCWMLVFETKFDCCKFWFCDVFPVWLLLDSNDWDCCCWSGFWLWPWRDSFGAGRGVAHLPLFAKMSALLRHNLHCHAS